MQTLSIEAACIRIYLLVKIIINLIPMNRSTCRRYYRNLWFQNFVCLTRFVFYYPDWGLRYRFRFNQALLTWSSFQLLDRDNFKTKLCNLFEPDSQFLRPQLDDIVKSLPFPTEIITFGRWNQIIQKINELGLRTLYGMEYEYAESITKRLASNLAEAGKLKKWPTINILIP